MAQKTLSNVVLQLRHDTASNWASEEAVVLMAGELGLDTTNNILKIGNGTDSWADLPSVTFANPISEINADDPGEESAQLASSGSLAVVGNVTDENQGNVEDTLAANGISMYVAVEQ